MSKTSKKVASTYHYDPLNRLSATDSIQRFYNRTRIATEIEGERKNRFFEVNSQPLALQQSGHVSTLLVTDQQTSVVSGISPDGSSTPQAFTPFGHHPDHGMFGLWGFNGQRPEALTGHYLLGQGYRAFNPVLMRFNSPDSWSPFGRGGINAYAYCPDPIMMQDPSGHWFKFARSLWKGIKRLNPMRTPKSKFKPSATPSSPSKAKAAYTPSAPSLSEIIANAPTLNTPIASAPVTRDTLVNDLAINTQALNKMSHWHDRGVKALASVTPSTSKQTVVEVAFLTDGFKAAKDKLTQQQYAIQDRLGLAPAYGRDDALPTFSDSTGLSSKFKEGLDTLTINRDSIRL